ncbi:protein-export chaperone SecB [Aeromonas caviae]|uniref:protein-export chaperone SecB n=1 Tax=Aeromonas caviae TaxID=648 RepID=UPI002B45C161|nr:protein-export chaperone SecB [Aeromonas caviae]
MSFTVLMIQFHGQRRMNLKIDHMQVSEMMLSPSSQITCFSEKESFELEFSTAYKPDDTEECSFVIVFDLRLKVHDTHYLAVKYHALFLTDSPITSDFQNSPFPKVNAPAIAFPFLRSFVATTLLNAGFEPILLPSINFQAMYNRTKAN